MPYERFAIWPAMEKLARLESTKLTTPARLPEIDLVNVGKSAKKAIPVVIGNTNV